jgi:ABC-type Fe3+ transport system substrate-binding protein
MQAFSMIKTNRRMVSACLALLIAMWPAKESFAQSATWQSDWERVKAEARKEGKLVVGIPANPTLRTQIETAMKQKFGIEVELVLSLESTLAKRIADEHKAGIRYFDVIIVTVSDVASALRPIGAVEPLEKHWILPEVSDPKNWWGGHIWGDKDNKLVYYPNAHEQDNIWYNTDVVKESELKSWDDLLNPKLRGKIGLFDPRISGAGRGIWGFMWQVKGEDYLRKLAEQKLVVGEPRPIADQLARGRLAITIGPTFYTLHQFTRVGLPIKPLPRMAEGTYVSVGNGGPVVIADPPHPNATKVFVNWLLSKEGQEMFTKAMGQASRRFDVDTTWTPSIGLRAAKDVISVDDFHKRENQSELRDAEVRLPALKFARTLFD